jgi:hypothetical protein
MTSNIPGALDVALKFVGAPIGAVGNIAINESRDETPGAEVGRLRGALAAGELQGYRGTGHEMATLTSAGIGTRTDRSA